MIRIMIVENNEVVRKGLSKLFSAESDMELAAEASGGQEAIRLLEDGTQIDIILADLNMHGMGGIEMTENISLKFPEAKVIILTMHEKSIFVAKAINAGAEGYVMKHSEMSELLQAVRLVAAGGTYY